jgi:hypothetical protein
MFKKYLSSLMFCQIICSVCPKKYYLPSLVLKQRYARPEAVLLVVWDHSINELWPTKKGLCIDLYGSRLLTACS